MVYQLTCARWVLGGDNAEYLVLAETGGVAHPSGYPLYLLYLRTVGRALGYCTGGAPAEYAARATALLGAFAVGALYVAARRWRARPALAACAALAWGLSPSAWIAATHAEVFALNALCCAAILCVAAPSTPAHRSRHGLWLGLIAGLSLSNHLTSALLAPVGLVALFRVEAAAARKGMATLLASAGLLLGLSPYLTLLQHADADVPWSWGAPNTFADVIHHVLRRDYGVLQLGLTDQGGTPLDHVQWLLEALSSDLHGLPLLGLPLFILTLTWRPLREAAPRRAEAWALLAAFLLTGPLLVSRFQLGNVGTAAAVTARFYQLPELLACTACAVGLSALATRLAPLLSSALALVPCLILPPLLSVARFLDRVDEHHNRAVEAYLHNALVTAPEHAILLGTGDHRLFGFAYVAGVERTRLDVTYVDPILLHHAWYRSRMEQRLGTTLPSPVGKSIDTVQLAASLLATGRPLLLTNLFNDRIVASFPSYPLGPLVRVLGAGNSVPQPAQLLELNKQLLERLDLDYPEPKDPDSWAFSVQREYERPWQVIAQAPRR